MRFHLKTKTAPYFTESIGAVNTRLSFPRRTIPISIDNYIFLNDLYPGDFDLLWVKGYPHSGLVLLGVMRWPL